MIFKFLLGLCLVNLIKGEYLLVDIEDHENSVVDPSENRPRSWGEWDVEWLEWKQQQDLPKPIPPSQKRRRCIPSGGKCFTKSKFSISVEFSFRSSRKRLCCEGYTCVSGVCMKPRINISGLNIGKGMQ